jgi:hypothetical protein
MLLRHIVLVNIFFITSIGAVCAAPDLQKELPVIRVAAARNQCAGDLFYILLAIRMAENGRSGLEFGVMHPKANDLDSQAGWAAATVVKNYQRWIKAGKPKGYIQFLGDRYCPVGADNDPNGLNRHWVGNVTYWYKKLRRAK